MSIIETNIIDGIVYNKKLGLFYLIVADHMAWDEDQHLALLKNKLEVYINYIESGQFIKENPKALNKKPIILVLAKYSFDSSALAFLEQVKNMMKQMNIELEYRMWTEEDELLK